MHRVRERGRSFSDQGPQTNGLPFHAPGPAHFAQFAVRKGNVALPPAITVQILTLSAQAPETNTGPRAVISSIITLVETYLTRVAESNLSRGIPGYQGIRATLLSLSNFKNGLQVAYKLPDADIANIHDIILAQLDREKSEVEQQMLSLAADEHQISLLAPDALKVYNLFDSFIKLIDTIKLTLQPTPATSTTPPAPQSAPSSTPTSPD